MGYFKDLAIARITLPSNKDYWVDIQTDFTWGQIKQLSKVTDDGSVEFEATADKFLLLAIKSWNLDDADGNIVEINSETIDRLEKDDVMAIIEKASGVIADEESKKNSSSQSIATSAAQK